MDIRKLQRAIVDGLEDVKAQHIVVFNTEALSPLFERVIIASGTSNRQTKALASSVRDSVRQAGLQVLRTEGEDNGEWIIVDCGAAVAHIMQPSIREYYHLEEIWGGKPVSMKLAGAQHKLVKAGDDDNLARMPAAKKSTGAYAGKAPPRKASNRPAPVPAKGPARASDGAAPARAAATKKAPARRAAPVKAGTGKSVVGRATAGKTAPHKSAPGKTTASKTAARKAPVARKAAPSKAAPRKATPRKTTARG